MNASVAAIVLTWNSEDEIEQCLSSLFAQSPHVDIVVVDNSSADDTEKIVRRHEPDLVVLQTGSNLGYAGGVNVGLKWAMANDYEYAFLLNPDAFVEPEAIATLLRAAQEQPSIAAACPSIFEADGGHPWYLGGTIDWSNGHTSHVVLADPAASTETTPTERMSGAAVLITLRAAEAVGLLDEDYFLYYEETDWSVRFTNAGWSIVVVPKARAWHAASSSTGGFYGEIYRYYMTRNRIYFLSKFKYGVVGATIRTVPLLAREAKHAWSERGLRAAGTTGKTMAAGCADALLGRTGRRNARMRRSASSPHA